MAENHVDIEINQCKGCRLCIEACPTHSLVRGSEINKSGYQYTKFTQNGCTACGFCYYICPEPGTITVIKAEQRTAAHG
ncbi:MAG: 4Fe-4S binding protein [Spirochaetales bacterium]|jgi:formate hydrogenlyase subunit 6/NADH:ubiquinone oxidoreductase subunit I|nr:4Fe-4S binding protein [Spirochaetales bacterium]